MPDIFSLWEVPESDFAEWCLLVNAPPEVNRYRLYLTMLATVQAEQERHGVPVRRVVLSLADMQVELDQRGWPNDNKQRLAVVHEIGRE